MQCKKCKKDIPSKYLRDYNYLFLSPLCPLCAIILTKRVGRSFEESTLYDDFISQGDYKLKHAWGGHMINPPGECTHRFIDKDGGEWVDLAFCSQICKNRCQRRISFGNMTMQQRKQELEDEGVVTV